MNANSTAAIAAVAAEAFGVPLAKVVRSGRGNARLVRARQAAMWLSAKLAPRSLTQIGDELGGRDRTTIRHGIRQVESLVAHAALIADLEASIRAAQEIGDMPDGDLIEIRERVIDPREIAGRVLSGERGPTSVSMEELRALARAVLLATINETGDDNAE